MYPTSWKCVIFTSFQLECCYCAAEAESERMTQTGPLPTDSRKLMAPECSTKGARFLGFILYTEHTVFCVFVLMKVLLRWERCLS